MSTATKKKKPETADELRKALKSPIQIIEPREARRLYFKVTYGIDVRVKKVRQIAAKHSFRFFCEYYLDHYFTLHPADFHLDLFRILQDKNIDGHAIIGFRGSAKSTISSFAFPLWCALTRRYNFILVINDTVSQMELNIANIKIEVEDNKRIREDFNAAPTDKWTRDELLMSSGVYIMGRSRGQKVRGLRWRQYRPDLIIVDDAEDLEWVRKKANRDKTERWFLTEVVSGKEEAGAKMVVIGNLLHKDALMARLKKMKMYEVSEFPLIDPKTKKVTWVAKYPTIESLRKKKREVKYNTIWSREFLLKVVSEEDQVVKEEEVHYYDVERLITPVHSVRINALNGGTGVDLAISEKETADLTAMVSGILAQEDGQKILYIKPSIVHKRIDLAQTVEAAATINNTMPQGSKFFVEDVGYQKAAIKEMQKRLIPVVGVRPVRDKRARFETAALYIKQGVVRFPQNGCKELFTEMFGFGVEEHDDLVDAMVYLILGMFDTPMGTASVGRPK